MLDLTFLNISRLCANAANFVRWQIWLSALVLGLSSLPVAAADDITILGDQALITNAEVGSYLVRSGVNKAWFKNGHAALASKVDGGDHFVVDIEGPGDVVRERSFTEFRTTKDTGAVNPLMGVGHSLALDNMTSLEKQMYRREVLSQAARAVGRNYVVSKTSSDAVASYEINFLWNNPVGYSEQEKTFWANGVPVVASTYRCDGLMEWAYEAALAIISPINIISSVNAVADYVDPAKGAYKINNGSVLFGGVTPKDIYAGATSSNTSVRQATVTDVDRPNMSLVSPSIIFFGDNYSVSFTPPYDQSGVKAYKYGWVLDGLIGPPQLINNLMVVGRQPSVSGIYKFLIYAEDNFGHWSTDAERYQSSSYSIPSSLGFVVGSRIQINSSIGLTVRSSAAGGFVSTEANGAAGTIAGGPQWAILGGTYYKWWQINWDDGQSGWSAADSLVSGPVAGVVTIPTVTTGTATSITSNSAVLNGAVTSNGGAPILERRFDWGSNYTSNVTVSGSSFSYLLTGLAANTTYTYRAWASNSQGFSVPVSQSFKTDPSTTPTNGACGPVNNTTVSVKPSTNLCSIGAASPVSASSPWTWSCNGINGGAPASCVAYAGTPAAYNISVSASVGGTVSGGGSWAAGTTATVIANANSGYRFVSWTENGGVVSTSATYPFTASVSRNLIANFSASLLVPGNPYPANGAADVPRINTTFSWFGGGSNGAVEYSFYFDTNPNPGIYIGWGGTSGSSAQVAYTLQPATTYYWKVKARDSFGAITESQVWQFTTAYSLPDLVVSNVALNGTVAPGANITADVTVQNIGNYPSAGGYYAKLYLSRSPGAKETRLAPNVSYYLSNLQPGATQTFNIPVTLNDLQAGVSYIDAWVDSTGAGSAAESRFDNNTRSTPISYVDTVNPNVTYLALQNTFIRTGVANNIMVSATDDVGIRALDFYYSVDSGATWAVIQEGYVPAAQVKYGISIPWTIPNSLPINGNLLVKAVAHDTSGNTGEKSAGPYTVKDGTVPGITVLSPNGGEVLDLGSTQTIKWNASVPNGISSMSLYLYYGNTASVIANITSNNTGSYTWTVPSSSSYVTNSARIKIEVTDLNGNHNEDWSDNFFSIRDASAPPPAPWNTPAVITSVPSTNWPYTSKADSSPVIVTDKFGTAHMVYTYVQDDTSGLMNNTSPARVVTQQILYKKLVSGGWTAPAVVYSVTQSADGNHGVDYNIGNLRLAVDSSGYPHLVWRTSYGAVSEWQKNDVFYTFFNGAGWSVPENLSSEIRGGFNVNSLSWRSMANLPIAGYPMSSAVIGGKLYVIGGGATQVFDPSTNAWTGKSSSGVNDGSATELNGKIYALNYDSSNIRIYDPVADSWTFGAAISSRGQGVILATANGRVYAIGGNLSGLTQEYDPVANTWSTKANMPTPRDYAAVATVNNKIYVIGGGTNGGIPVNSIEVYDPANDTWTTAAKPIAGDWPASRGGAACVMSGRIYLLGGSDDAKRVFEYDPQANAWQIMNSMQYARSFAACGSINSKLYVAGGYSAGAQLSFVEEASISSGLVGAVSGSPTIGIDKADKVHVIWNDGGYYEPDGTVVLGFKYAGTQNIYHRIKSVGAWSQVAQITTAGGSYPAMTVDQADKVHIAFLGWNGSSQNIGYTNWNAGTWSAPSTITVPVNGSIDLASDTTGHLHLTWFYYDVAAQSGQIRYSAFDGTVWSASEVISGTGQLNNNYPSIVTDLLNRPHVIWEGQTGSGKLLYSAKLGGQWLNPIQVNNSSQYPSSGSSDAALSRLTDELYVVWASAYNSSSEIFYNHANVGYATDIFAPSVVVSSPNLGSTLSAGTSTAIVWSAYDNVGVADVDLHYSTDNGATWTLIAANQPNSGSYDWVIPNVASLQVRLAVRDAAGNKGTGFSNNLAISNISPPSVSLTAPIDGTNLSGNSSVNLTWTATDNNAVTGIDLEYSLDGGITWLQIANGVANSGSYAWQVPDVSTTTLLIRITAHNGAGLVSAATSQPLSIVRGNTAPIAPSLPFPIANGVNVPVNLPMLQWTSGDVDGDALTYQVKFGTTSTPPVVGAVSSASYATGTLLYATRYYWQVVASDGKATTAGPLWSFTTEKANQSITVTTAAPATAAYNSQFTVAATAPGGAVSYSSGSTGVCTNSGATFTMNVPSGICVVQYDQTGSSSYNAAQQATSNTSAGKASQTISFGAVPSVVVGGIGTVSALGGASGNDVTFSSTTPSVCTISGSTITGVAAGICLIVADQAGNANYNAAAQVTQNITVGTASQTISFGAAPTVVVSGTGTVSATGGASANPVTFSSTTTGVCTVSGSTVTGIAAGTCTIAANQAGDANYNAAAQVTQTITVAAASTPANLTLGWNLLGNSINAPLDVAATLGDAAKVTTVWKWIPATSKWAFYTPQQTDGGAAYAATKGYDALATINGGEGFWVNAKAAFTVQLPTGTLINTSYFQNQFDPTLNKLIQGWNLIATGDNVTPSVFNQGLSVTPPAQGVIPLNVTTLWAWDSGLSSWYFYAPSLEASGGLENYITSKNYLDFTQHNKTLGQGVGFWVNKP